jgi:hypothetical protein
MPVIYKVLHERVSSIVNRVFYDVIKPTAKTSENRFHTRPEIKVAFHGHAIVWRMAFLNAGKELRRVRPGQSHVRRANRPTVKADLTAVQHDRPFEIPIFKHPKRGYARCSDVLPYGTITSRQDKRLLNHAARCSL